MGRHSFREVDFRWKANDDPQDNETIDRPCDDLCWPRLINFERRDRMKMVDLPVRTPA